MTCKHNEAIEKMLNDLIKWMVTKDDSLFTRKGKVLPKMLDQKKLVKIIDEDIKKQVEECKKVCGNEIEELNKALQRVEKEANENSRKAIEDAKKSDKEIKELQSNLSIVKQELEKLRKENEQLRLSGSQGVSLIEQPPK